MQPNQIYLVQSLATETFVIRTQSNCNKTFATLPSQNQVFKMHSKYTLQFQLGWEKTQFFNQIIFCGLLVLVMIHHGHQQAMMFVIFISTYVICIVNRAQACLVPSGISMGENSIYPLVCKEQSPVCSSTFMPSISHSCLRLCFGEKTLLKCFYENFQ